MAESCASANMNIRLMGSIALSVALSIMPMSKLANVIMQSPSAPRGRLGAKKTRIVCQTAIARKTICGTRPIRPKSAAHCR